MLRKQIAGALVICGLLVATVAGWIAGAQTSAIAADDPTRLSTAAREDDSGRVQIPAYVLNELIYEHVESAMKLAAERDDSANPGPIPSHLELELTCGGDYILIWWTNDDGSIEWDAECCDGEC